MDVMNQGPSVLPDPEPLASFPLDLRFWLVVVGVAGVGGLMLGQGELAAMVALAGLFAASHAADLEPAHRSLYRAVAWIVPVAGMLAFAGLGNVLIRDPDAEGRTTGLVFAGLGMVTAFVTSFTPLAAALARRLFGVAQPSSTLRLTARLALLGALLYPVATISFPSLLESITESGGSLLGRGSLWGNVIGLTLLAFGGVGFRVRRDLRETLARLGLGEIEARHWAIVGLGVVALVVLNAGAELLQRAWLPDLWASDQRVNRAIAGGLSRSDMLLLGLSAGIGEEISLRGALQPKLGVVLTALVFALLHVQYSWFGVGIICLLGLALGAIRDRTTTTVAILVHALYDIFAVFTVQP